MIYTFTFLCNGGEEHEITLLSSFGDPIEIDEMMRIAIEAQLQPVRVLSVLAESEDTK